MIQTARGAVNKTFLLPKSLTLGLRITVSGIAHSLRRLWLRRLRLTIERDQTMASPLADAKGNPVERNIRYWLDIGIDYSHIASNDVFHERQRPDYPWEELRQNLRDYSEETGVEIWIYGKAPVARIKHQLEEMERTGGVPLMTFT